MASHAAAIAAPAAAAAAAASPSLPHVGPADPRRATSSPPPQCRFMKGVGFPRETSGGDLPCFSADDCCRLCWLDTSCLAAAFIANSPAGGGICSLKTSLDTPTGAAVNGSLGCALLPDPSPPPSDACGFSPNMQLYDPGSTHTLSPVGAATKEACCGVCTADRTCVAAELYGTSCYKKNAKLPLVKQVPPPGIPLIACVTDR